MTENGPTAKVCVQEDRLYLRADTFESIEEAFISRDRMPRRVWQCVPTVIESYSTKYPFIATFLIEFVDIDAQKPSYYSVQIQPSISIPLVDAE